MPRFTRLVFAVALAALFIAQSAGEALANHVQCGEVIAQDTRLDSDLVDCPADGIVIGAADIELDLNGHTIDGVGTGTGVGNAGYDRVEIENGTISGFQNGMILSRASDNRLLTLTVTANNRGIALESSSNNHVANNVLENNGSSIHLGGSDDNTVAGNEVVQQEGLGEVGIEVGSCCGDAPRSHNNLVVRNSVSMQDEGVRVIGSENRIERNRVRDTRRNGIVVAGSSNWVEHNLILNTLYSGLAPFSGISGISLATARNSRIERNSVSGYYDAIRLNDSTDNLIRKNRLFGGPGLRGVSGSPVKGVYLFASSDRNKVEGNVVSATAIGIYASVNDSQIERNVLSGNHSALYIDYDSSRTAVRRNVAINSNAEAITIAGSETLVMRNVASDNDGAGFLVFRPGTVVERNVADGNRLTGINVLVAGVTVKRNTANRNGELGIEAIPGVIDGGGNTAFGNGNPLQCLNVVCTRSGR